MAESKTNKQNTKGKVAENNATEEENAELESELRLEWEPHPFEAFGKTTRIKLSELAASISEQFKVSFNDYLGTNINFNGRNFDVTLIFEKGKSAGEGKIDNLVDFKNNTGFDKKNLYSSMTYLNKKTSGKTYELNEETKEMLSDIMYGGRKAKRDWSQLVNERRYPAPIGCFQPGAENISIMVTGIDINRLLQLYFGNTMVTSTIETEDGVFNKKAPARYNIRVGKYLPNGEIMLNIEQFDFNKVQEMALKENPTIPNTNGLVYF